MQNAPSDIIAAAEAARILEIDRSTLTRQAVAGKVPTATKLPGKRGAYLFSRSVIEQLAADRRVEGGDAS
jgi:hypothetical protein